MKLVFDIGANIGKTVDIFKTKSEKVIAFEANPNLTTSLENKFSGQNVLVVNKGLSNENGIKKFNIASYHTISTFAEDWINESRFSNSYNWNQSVDISTITLDSAIDEYGIPDYIKIDVEGYEYEVLTSFTKLLPNTIFAFEWAEEQKNKIEKIINHIKSLGYTHFSYTEADDVLFDNQISWTSFESFNLLENLNPNRKDKWGMIYFKK